MRIGIDATCWSNPRGYGRYARGLLTALLTEPQQHEYILFVDNQTYANSEWPIPEEAELALVDTKISPSKAASASERRSLQDVWAMAAAVGSTQLDVLFFPSVYTYFPVRTDAQILVGIHDIIAESYPNLVFPERKRRYLWGIKNWLARRQADMIITVSEHARAGIVEHFHWPVEKTWVVGEAPDAVFRRMIDGSAIDSVLASHNLTRDSRYIMCLGGLNPHKNVPMLLAILAQLRNDPTFADLKLLLVGPAESDNFTPGAGRTREQIEALQLDGAVHLTGYIPDEEVVCLLNAAMALVMPSFDEGYGLGAVEAAACGTPVIATANSPLPQLLAGGGYFIDPHRPDELNAALRQLLRDDDHRRNLGRMAQERASELTWARAAGQFCELLDALEANGQ